MLIVGQGRITCSLIQLVVHTITNSSGHIFSPTYLVETNPILCTENISPRASSHPTIFLERVEGMYRLSDMIYLERHAAGAANARLSKCRNNLQKIMSLDLIK